MIKRGKIYYIENIVNSQSVGSEQFAGRPAVIVSNDKNNQKSETVEIVYLTTQNKSDLPTHVRICSTGIMSTALCEQITTVSKKRIGKYIATCSEQEVMLIDVAMSISIGIDFSINDGTAL